MKLVNKIVIVKKTIKVTCKKFFSENKFDMCVLFGFIPK